MPSIMGVKAKSIVGETVNVMSDVLEVVAYTEWTVTAALQDTIGALSAPGVCGCPLRRLSIQYHLQTTANIPSLNVQNTCITEHDIELYSSHFKDAVDRNNKEIQPYIRPLEDTC